MEIEDCDRLFQETITTLMCFSSQCYLNSLFFNVSFLYSNVLYIRVVNLKKKRILFVLIIQMLLYLKIIMNNPELTVIIFIISQSYLNFQNNLK